MLPRFDSLQPLDIRREQSPKLRSSGQSQAQGEALRALGSRQLYIESREAATENRADYRYRNRPFGARSL